MKQDNARPVATMSKPEAVWRAIEELGTRADVNEILEYVRTRFGIDPDAPSPDSAEAVAAAPVAAPPPAPAPVTQVARTDAVADTKKPAGQKKPKSRSESAE